MAEDKVISRIGKLPELVLERSVLKQVRHRRPEVLKGPGVGIDCAAVTLGEDEALVLSSDPVTGTKEELGRHCIHVTANDLAAAGAEPIGVMLTALLPPGITEQKIREIVRDAEETCASLHMEMMGGHTEITGIVSRPLISVTGVGRICRTRMLSAENIRPGMDLVISKWVGLEATAILAKAHETELRKRFSEEFVRRMQDCGKWISVLPEARIAMEHGVTAMHDITEGGVFGALWEMAEAGRTGLEADARLIPVRQETVELCEFFGLNPYQSMSSGALLMVTEDGEGLVQALEAEGIPATVVGRTTEGNDRILRNREEVRFLERPQADEIYKVNR